MCGETETSRGPSAAMRDLFSAPTRALLVQPRFSGRGFWNCTGVCRLTGARYPAAPLGLLTVATLMPQHWRFRLVDENVRPLTGADIEWAGIVLTGGMLPQQAATLAVMAKSRAGGRPVVLGGPDATEQPWRYEGPATWYWAKGMSRYRCSSPTSLVAPLPASTGRMRRRI